MSMLFTPSVKVPPRPPGRPTVLREQGHMTLRNRAREYRIEGMTFREIAATMRRSVSTIHDWLKMDDLDDN